MPAWSPCVAFPYARSLVGGLEEVRESGPGVRTVSFHARPVATCMLDSSKSLRTLSKTAKRGARRLRMPQLEGAEPPSGPPSGLVSLLTQDRPWRSARESQRRLHQAPLLADQQLSAQPRTEVMPARSCRSQSTRLARKSFSACKHAPLVKDADPQIRCLQRHRVRRHRGLPSADSARGLPAPCWYRRSA